MPRKLANPREGNRHQIIVPSRVSNPGEGKQDERSTRDQREEVLRRLDEYVGDEPFEVTSKEWSGSGEFIERREFLELCEMIETEKYDLLIVEDLGRILRRIKVYDFCELCVEHGTRVVALGDYVDTVEEGWQERVIMAGMHHERSNRDSSGRIKRGQNGRFADGGCAAFNIAGYIKPEGAKTDKDWRKDPAWESIYKEWFERLEAGQWYAEIADWLNSINAAVGPFCRNAKWDGKMVARVTHNHLLKGYRFRNKKMSVRDRKGKYNSEDAPPEMIKWRHVKHLAFFDPEYYDRVVNAADSRHANKGRGKAGSDPLRGRPKKKTRFPGQSLHCGICGRPFVFGGHGQTDRLMCSGAREYKCWNGVTADAHLTSERVLQSVLDALQSLPEFDEQFLAMVNEEANAADTKRATDIAACEKRVAELERKFDNLTEAFGEGKKSDRRQAKLDSVESDLDEEERRLIALGATPSEAVVVPGASELRSSIHDTISDLPIDGWDFCREMRKLVPRIVVFPHQLLDGGKVELRARFKLNLAGMLTGERLREALTGPLERVVEIDLFRPPQRAALLEEIFELRKTMTERAVAAKLKLTITATQRAASLRRKMMTQGFADPWIAITEPSDSLGKLKRHRHKRYKFDPLPDPDRL